MKKELVLFILIFIGFALPIHAQTAYRGEIRRADGNHIVFNMEEKMEQGKLKWTIRNAEERLEVSQFNRRGDSLLVQMPFFDAELLLKKTPVGYEGSWLKRGSTGNVLMPIVLVRGKDRYNLPASPNRFPASGRWKTTFTNASGKSSIAMAEFKQNGKNITGTFLTPTGDYRFLEGSIQGDSLVMSTFDGTHAFVFRARLSGTDRITRGVFASGPTSLENWEAIRDEQMELDGSSALMSLKGDEKKLSFTFPDLDSNLVSIKDERFKGKVVVIQIMGSWCPNCMDEISFLSKYHKENRQSGVEMIGLAYEYTTDFAEAKRRLSRFRDKFSVDYPMLITGVKSSDEFRTEKTLPQMTAIKAFPSMIILGKDGTVRKTHAGYDGPATGIHHEKFKEEFDAEIKMLLAEKQ
jgi:thiol-disulfide isomerase/thioredoxin